MMVCTGFVRELKWALQASNQGPIFIKKMYEVGKKNWPNSKNIHSTATDFG